MQTSGFKKYLSLFLSIIMIFTMIPSMLFNVSAEESYPVIERYTAASSTEFHAYYAKIYSVTFLDEIDWNDINSAEQYWDSSAADDGSVISYIKYNESQSTAAGADRYDLYIAGDGGVGANPTSSYVFYSFSALKEVNGLENFKTENATTFYQMFGVCRSLEYVDFSNCDTSDVVNLSYMFNQCENLETVIFAGWDTSNVTDMSSMFYNCKNMKTLDLSSFDTSKVTTMRYMFYHCEKLEYVYVGDGWTTESVANLNDGMFNCCYAIVGGKDVYDSNFIYGAPGAEYATTKEDGGFLDYKAPAAPVKYTVSYVFDGATVPTGVTVPVSAEYDAGTTVKVSDSLYADGYVFSGWKTTDTVVTDGEFVIENNVVFTGSWSELYNVTYAYADGYDVPAGAPAVPVTAAYKAGDAVTVADIPFVDGYVFVGWDTDDISVTDGKFAMPGNDVTLYGYFKKPVESVEINGGDIVLDKNGEAQINVTVRPDDATVKDIEYNSSDENVVKVDEDGKVTAVGVGTATITVNSKDDPSKSDTISVTVKVPVTSITVDKTEITLNKDASSKIAATVTPADATNKTLIYESADESVVTVDANGNIIAVGEGETIITVTSEDDPTVKETVSVKVKIPVTEIIVTENISLNVGDETNLNAKVNADATEKGLDYETSDPGVVKVFADGSILATGKGEAVITVTSKDDPTKKETVKVTVTVPVEDVVVDKTDITLDVGKKDKLTVTVTPDDASDKGVTYTSSNNSVVTVDENGNITAVGKGEAVITVTSKDDPTKKETVKVTVTVPVEDVVVDKTDITLDIGKKDKLTVTVKPDDASDKGVTYTSSNNSVVTVDENGNITAVGKGEAVITVTSKDDPTKKETVKVTVTVPVEDVIVDKTDITLDVGKKDKLTVTVTPDDASDKGVTFTSSNNSVVTVDENGNITAVGKGEAVITVTSKDDPTKKETVKVTVTVPVEDVFVDKTDITLDIGKKDKLTVTVTPDDASDKGVTYTSSNNSVVTVDENGNITAVGKGEAVITVTSKDDPTKKETVKVTVTVPVEDVVVDKTDITLDVGKKDKLTVTVTPDDASDKGVTYISSNNSVVTVDENGNITAVGKGEAVITVTSKDDPTKKETVKVTVTVPVEDVVVDKTDITLDVGKKDKLTVTVTPDDASDKGVTYTSSNNSVVTVDENGNITAVGKGEAVITVTSKDDPTKKETVKVTVTVPVDKITVNKSEMLLTVGKTDKIAVKVTPDDASDKNVTFTSGDNSIATVDKYGNVTAVGEGETYITIASVSDPSKTKTVKVRVYIPENPGYLIEVPENAEVAVGETVNLGIKVTPAENAPKAVYDSSDESIVMVDADGNITGVGPGKTTIIAEFETGEIFIIHVTVAEPVVVVPVVHHVCFGKTDGIGWYEVSVNGGEFLPQGPNSTLEVEHGSVLVIRVQDMWIGDEFDFYVNGDRRPVDENNTITVVVEGYMLIGALSMDVVVPDPEESLTLFERLINAIKAFFEKIAEFFSF